MAAPAITVEQVQHIIPTASEIQELDRGGQKVVFTGTIDGKKYALKFMEPDPSRVSAQGIEYLDDVTSRAQREVETMQQCSNAASGRYGANRADCHGN